MHTFTPLHTREDHLWNQPAPGRVVEAVDEAGQPVPTGVQGRIRIDTHGGPAGYLDDAAASRDFFRDGFFYPGDLAVMRADGRFALQGRLTDVISVRGHKISPTPIEERLSETLGVSAVCLFSMPGENGDEELNVVIESATAIDSSKLDIALRQEIPGFQRAHIYYFAALARNRMGKLMRQEVRVKAIASRSRL